MNLDMDDYGRRQSTSTASSYSQNTTVYTNSTEINGSDDGASTTRPRKRQRCEVPRNLSHTVGSSRTTAVAAPPKKPKLLIISDIDEVKALLAQRFKDLQQHDCKVIAKLFIKTIEPKKQTKHPYSGGSGRAPSWWPPCPPGGNDAGPKVGFVRHREPDHLSKHGKCVLVIR